MQTVTKYFKTKFYEIEYFALNLIYSNKISIKLKKKKTDIDACPIFYASKS